jgi:hypothetical protein
MFKRLLYIVYCFSLLSFSNLVISQKIHYTTIDKDEPRSSNFEIIGKLKNNYLIYKSYRNNFFINVYNTKMELVEKNDLSFLPDKLLGASFVTYKDFSYMFYQYQKRGVMYSMAVKLDETGKNIGDPIELDTTSMNYTPNNIYSILVSEDKQKIASIKVNNRNDNEHILKTVLFDVALNQVQQNFVPIAMPDRNDFLYGFQIDNDGDIAFLRAVGSAQQNNIYKLSLIIKPANNHNIVTQDIKVNKLYLDDISIKVNNINKTFLVSSFYSSQRRGNIDGIFCFLWDKVNAKTLMNNTGVFSEELRAEAKGNNSTKAAFNDYYLRNIIFKLDGGFIVIAESVYTSSRSGGMNSRWDYLNNANNWGGVNGGFYAYDNIRYGSPWYPWGSYGSYNNITRYYADNILMISYDSATQIQWTNVIAKSQYDDDTDNLLGYSLINTGENLRFLFNVQERRNWVLNEQALSENGQVNRSPTLKGLENNYEFLPRYAKQVSAKQIIVPCLYRGYVCFAKISL